MVIDEKTVQVNSFTKGMNTDMSDSQILDSQYRFARNVRYVTNQESTSGELHIIEGATSVVTLPNEVTEIIETTQLRDLGIVIAKTSFGWGVYTIDTNKEKYVIQRVYATSDCSRVATQQHILSECPNGEYERLSLVTRFEDTYNQKLYIADGHGPIMLVRIAYKPGENPYDTRIDPTVEAIGDPGEIDDTIDAISSAPPVKFYPIKFCGLIDGGAIKGAVVQYAYNFSSKYAAESPMSPVSKMIPLYRGGLDSDKNDIKGVLTEKDSSGTPTITDQARKGVRIKIPIDANNPYSIIHVYRLIYTDNEQTPVPEEFHTETITPGESITINDVGTKNSYQDITLEEFNSKTGLRIVPKTIEAKDDWLFAADFSTQEDALITDIDETIISGDLNFRAKSYNAYGQTYADGETNPYIDVNKRFLANDTNAFMYEGPGSKKYLGGCAKNKNGVTNISWRFITTAVTMDKNPDSQKIVRNDYIFTANPTKYYIVYDNGLIKYEQSGNIDLSQFIEVSDRNNCYSNAQVTYSLKSLQRGSLYRFGIVLYDKYGNKTPTEFIQDIRVPNASQCKLFESSEGKLVCYPIGIEFKVDLGNQNEYVAYEIVRCKRGDSDRNIVTQCVLSRPIKCEGSTETDERRNIVNNTYYPTGLITVLDYYIRQENPNRFSSNVEDPYGLNFEYYKNRPRKNLIQLIYPDLCYNDNSIMQDYQDYTIELIDYIAPYRFDPDTSIKIGNTNIWSQLIYWYKFYNSSMRIPIGVGQKDLKGSIFCDSNIYGDPSAVEHMYGRHSNTTDGNGYNTIDETTYIKLYKHGSKNDSLNDLQNKKETVYTISNVKTANNFSVDSILEEGNSPYDYTGDFVNWIFGASVARSIGQYLGNYNDQDYTGPGGVCAYCNLNEVSGLIFDPDQIGTGHNTYIPGTYLCNICKRVNPYGDSSDTSLSLITWRSYGDYFNIQNREQVGHVFDGEYVIQPFEYVSMHKWQHPDEQSGDSTKRIRKYNIVYSIPIETPINLAYTSGFEYTKHSESVSNFQLSWIQLLAGTTLQYGGFDQGADLYKYNTVYSAEPNATFYASSQRNGDDGTVDSGDGSRDFRVQASVRKENNETTDNWLHFSTNQFLDVDSRYGKITNLRTFKDKLMFWQENAVGILSVNDRSLVKDQNSNDIMLGNSGLLSRFDYLHTSNGMHEYQYCDAQSDRFLYWWDNNKHEICQYETGQGVTVLSKTKYCQNFLNQMYETGKLHKAPILTFDKNFNELICNVTEGNDLNSGSLVYSEYTDAFVSMFGIDPHSKSVFRNKILFFKHNDKRGFRWNTLDGNVKGLKEEALLPYVNYIVNKQPLYVKAFDNGQIYGRIYGGSDGTKRTFESSSPLNLLSIKFSTPLKQQSILLGKDIDNTEYNFRFAIPRHNNGEYGNRMRGNTLSAELSSSSNSYDFSLQYIATKFRISWS